MKHYFGENIRSGKLHSSPKIHNFKSYNKIFNLL